jgi:hypothetical protein
VVVGRRSYAPKRHIVKTEAGLSAALCSVATMASLNVDV